MIRETTANDFEQILAFYPVAFPDEDLRPVVTGLIEGEAGVLSLAAFDKDALIGHVLFTPCGTERADRSGALLGPLGVLPPFQLQGVGSGIVRAGLERLTSMGVAQVFVLGDPAYYGRFGFAGELNIRTPCPIPEKWGDAWQSLVLNDQVPLAAGRLALPTPWMNPALWEG